MTCTDIDIYADIEHCTGQVNLPGTRNHIYMLKRNQVVKWPAVPTTNVADMEDYAKLTENFGLASEAKWTKLSLVPDANSFTAESQGNWGCKTFNNTVNAVMPGVQAEAAAFFALVHNDDTIFLVPQRDGTYRLFGNEMFQVTVHPKQESGAAAGDSAQTTLEISVTDDRPAPFYEGEIVTTEGKISGKDGKPVVG